MLEVHTGDRVRLRKPHPCGGYEWDVLRTGTDIGLKCCTCGHYVMLTRSDFNRRAKSITRPDKLP